MSDLPDASNQPQTTPPPSTEDGHANGEPDILPLTYCRKCNAKVKPARKGQCPQCGIFLRQNFVARTHPVNILRKQQILNRLVAEYRPDTTLLHGMCEDVAGIREQLEVMKPGSQEHKRLVELQQSIHNDLEASRSREPRTSIERFATLTNAQLIERTSAILHRLLELQDAESTPPVHDAADAGPVTEAAVPALDPNPKPVCEYCHGRCVGPEHSAFSTLHWSDPLEAKRRSEDATAVMLKMMPFGHRY